jgi:hypothetical protein
MRLAIVLALLGGCALGAGTSTVGIWRPHRAVDTDVCVQDGSDACTRTIEVARDLPERSFGGGLVAVFDPGYAYVTGAMGGTHNRFALDSHYEYLRGRGGVALGLRIGANLALDLAGAPKKSPTSTVLTTVPVTAVAHWGTERFSVYGGAGYTPYATDEVTDGDTSTTRRVSGFHVMAGTRAVLRTARSYRLSVALEVFRQYLDGMIATSATAGAGLHI